MQLYEKLLKQSIGKEVTVRYGRASGRHGGPNVVEGILVGFDRLCIALKVEGGVLVISKSSVESILLPDSEGVGEEVINPDLEELWY